MHQSPSAGLVRLLGTFSWELLRQLSCVAAYEAHGCIYVIRSSLPAEEPSGRWQHVGGVGLTSPGQHGRAGRGATGPRIDQANEGGLYHLGSIGLENLSAQQQVNHVRETASARQINEGIAVTEAAFSDVRVCPK
jgi:hypothetical protein